MRNLVLVGVAALAAGVLGALGYSHYLGEGKQLAELKAQLNDKDAALAKITKQSVDAKSETDAMSTQIQQLTATKQDLTHQVEKLKAAAAATPAVAGAPGPDSNPMAGIMKAEMADSRRQKFEMLVKRLNLTDDQQAALKVAMDAEDKRREDMTANLLAGGKMDGASALASLKSIKSADQTLNDILTPDQKTTYQQIKADEKSNTAETMASMEMNQMAMSLNLTEAQKDQVGAALYQNVLNMEDPAWLKANLPPSSATDPTVIIDVQEKAKEDALAKVLTPDQLATYHQQAQTQIALRKSVMQKFMPAHPTLPPANP